MKLKTTLAAIGRPFCWLGGAGNAKVKTEMRGTHAI